MNIIDRFKKWFFQEENIGLINIGDIIQIPGREYYKDDFAKLNQIDIYKEDYLKILSKKKLISSKEISFDNLEKEFLMHIELILNLYLNKEEISIITTEEAYLKEKINLMKLQLYFNEINNMENETIEKLIALEELSKGKRVPLVNRRLLNEKINNLKMILLSFRNQKVAISIEIKNYLMILNSNSLNEQIDSTYAFKKYEEVHNLAKDFISTNNLFNIDNLNIDYIAKIALIEKELEIYAYLHKKDTNILKQELVNIKNTPITSSNKEQLLERVTIIENKYYVFEEYGRGIITYENLFELYKLKFDILTYNINNLDKNPLIPKTKIEYKCYEEIINKKFECILMGKNTYLNDIYEEKTKQAIKEIAFYLKGIAPQKHATSIITDKYRLALLLAFDSENGLVKFFNQNMINTEEAIIKYGAKYNRAVFEFTESIPLDTCFQIVEANEMNNPNDSTHYNHPLYRLFKLTNNLPQYTTSGGFKTYFLPEGLKKINTLFLHRTDPLRNYINLKSNKNTVIFPYTMEEINGHLFYEYIHPVNVILNNGLKIIGDHALKHQQMEHLILPSTVELISRHAFDFQSIKWLYFNDFENSKLLHDKEALRTLIKELFYVFPVGINPKLEEVQDGVYREYILIGINTTLKDINLYNDKGKQILVINADRLSFNKKRFRSPDIIKKISFFPYKQTITWTDPLELNTLSLEDINDIIARLQTIIKEELGYNLVFTQHKEKTKKIIRK